MGDRNQRTHERALSAVDGVTVVFHTVDSHGINSGDDDDDDSGDEERTAARIQLQRNCHCVSCDGSDGDAEEAAGRSEESPESNERKTPLCPLAFCVRSPDGSAREDSEKPKRCPGLGLFYAFLSTVFFSIIALLVKTIKGVHAIEISAIRCFFQMLFTMPLLIYHNYFSFLGSRCCSICLHPSLSKTLFITSCVSQSNHPSIQSFIHPSSSCLCSSRTGFLGPRDKRIYLVLRGFIGSNAMILLFYAVQQMPLADATVIMFSNPVFTSILAWIFLKERCTIWDCLFTVFTITGVLLIARPPFLFGEHRRGIEGNYTNHIKGTIAAFAGAIGAALTFVVLRKMGKSVHYYLSVWYYAVIGFIECIITVSVLGEWKIPDCGRDRWMLMLIAVLGIAGQTFLTKALQIEKAGPVALMRTIDVVLAFIFQFIFLNRAPTMWSLGGALCVVASTSGVALRKWYTSTRKS